MFRLLITFNLCVAITTANIDSDECDKVDTAELGHPDVTNYCEFQVAPESLTYWRGKMAMKEPDAIHFNLIFSNETDYILNMGNKHHLLKPLQWVWTSNKAVLHWPLDHGLLSFGLLDAKTLYVPYVRLNVINKSSHENCTIVMGAHNTTYNIAQALMELVNENDTEKEFPEHDKHMFCFLHFKPSTNLTNWSRFMALYLKYPLALVVKSYRCSTVKFNYHKKKFDLDKDISDITGVWMLCVIAPYVASILLFMYFPIILMEIFAFFSQDEKLSSEQYRTGYTELHNDFLKDELQKDWVISDGTPPLTVLGTLGFAFKGFRQKHPVFKSRLVRFIGLAIVPLLMLPQLMLYKKGVNFKKTITINDLLKIGNPSNFLALLATDLDLMRKSNAPDLGGPIGVLVIYFLFGCILIVVPRSLKQVVENGIPKSRDCSVLFLSAGEIREMSGVHIVPSSGGYARAAAVCKCGIYMLVSRAFWARLFGKQSERFKSVSDSDLFLLLKLLLYLLLVFGSVFEIVLCLLLYGFPLINCLCITMKGAVVSIANMVDPRTSHRRCNVAILYPFLVLFWSLFTYSMAMIFMQVFMFASQVILFCFVAVFTYPSVSFGYLFFSVVLIFYVLRNIGEYGEVYQELLHTAVEISSEMNCKINDVVVQDEILYLNNFIAQKIKKICLNGTTLNIPSNDIQANAKDIIIQRTVVKDDAYGIPKDLFYRIVDKHKPVHVQMLHLFVKFALLTFFVTLARDVTSRSMTGIEPNTEISEVMHVVFVVVLGAVPRMLELALFNESKSVQRDIEHRRIEKTIEEYWHEKLRSLKPQGQGSYQNAHEKDLV